MGKPKTPEWREAIRQGLLARRGDTKTCIGCSQDLPLDSFPERRPNVLHSRCRPCTLAAGRERSARYYHRTPPAVRSRRNRVVSLRRWHGLTVEQFQELADGQDGRCAICDQSTDTLHIDHCHDSKVIRGLLCSPCNTAIGLLGDDPDRLLAAVEHLQRERPADALQSRPAMPSGRRPEAGWHTTTAGASA